MRKLFLLTFALVSTLAWAGEIFTPDKVLRFEFPDGWKQETNVSSPKGGSLVFSDTSTYAILNATHRQKLFPNGDGIKVTETKRPDGYSWTVERGDAGQVTMTTAIYTAPKPEDAAELAALREALRTARGKDEGSPLLLPGVGFGVVTLILAGRLLARKKRSSDTI